MNYAPFEPLKQNEMKCPTLDAGIQYSTARTTSFPLPEYGATEPIECEWATITKNPTPLTSISDVTTNPNENVYQNIQNGGQSCGYAWHGQLNARLFERTFQDDWYGAPTSGRKTWPVPPKPCTSCLPQ